MKKTFILLLPALLIFNAANSQTIDEAKKNIYYEHFETAKNILQSVIKRNDASPDAWYWLGEIYLEENNIDSAKKILENKVGQLSAENSSLKQNPLIFIGWAHLLLDSGLKEQAREQMVKVLEASKYKDPAALLAVANANIDSKNGDSLWAVELLGKAIKRDKKNAEIYTALGDAYRKIVDGSNAILSYDKALQINPSYAEAMFKKGRIYKTQKNVEIYLDRFSKAIQADSLYTPALYELYYYYYFRDVVKAKQFLTKYITNSEPSPKHAYMIADLDYVSQNWDLAINEAKDILTQEGSSAQPRLYKMIAYSEAALGDSSMALTNMNLYFEKQNDSSLVAKDFEMKATLLEHVNPDKSLAIEWYKKALGLVQDKLESVSYMINVADLQKQLGNSDREADWREKIYELKDRPTNLDIYKWGMALYLGKNYLKADSVFAIYEEKYPDQVHGYLWRARSNALIDTNMEKGLAVPHYLGLVNIISKDTAKNKQLLVSTFEYLGAYEANTTKDYTASLGYYDKILELDPENSDAIKYAAILKKWISSGKGNN
jgi:tetratricopeptide (TPR) repeat protein